MQEHKYILVTTGEAGKTDGGFNEGWCVFVVMDVPKNVWETMCKVTVGYLSIRSRKRIKLLFSRKR